VVSLSHRRLDRLPLTRLLSIQTTRQVHTRYLRISSTAAFCRRPFSDLDLLNRDDFSCLPHLRDRRQALRTNHREHLLPGFRLPEAVLRAALLSASVAREEGCFAPRWCCHRFCRA